MWVCCANVTAVAPEEVVRAEREVAAAEQHRQHLKRRRERQKEAHVGAVSAIIAALPAPGGSEAWRSYQPLLAGLQQAAPVSSSSSSGEAGDDSSSSSAGTHSPGDGGWAGADSTLQPLGAWWAPHPLRRALRPQALHAHTANSSSSASSSAGSSWGPILLDAAPVEEEAAAQLVLDWSLLPPACDPALGGRLTDMQAASAGQGRVGLRALRKRAQVSGGGGLLWLVAVGGSSAHMGSALPLGC